MTPLDHALAAVLALLSPLVDGVWLYPRHVRAVAAGVEGARARFYRTGLAWQWGLALGVLGLWDACNRSFAALHLGQPSAARLALGLALVVVYLVLALRTRRALLRRPEALLRLRGRLASASALLPRTPSESAGFAALAVSAGISEELLYRGFLPWYLTPLAGPLVAVLLSAALFGGAHAYLGRADVLRTSVVGLVLAGVVALAGSLLPAIAIHAAMDLLAGDLGRRAFA